MLNRRNLLKSALVQALILPAMAMAPKFTWADELPQFMLCAKNKNGDFIAIKLNVEGQIQQQFKLLDRGHGHAKSINGEIAIFARRPNNQLYLIDKMGKLDILYAPDGRHFFGHGEFSTNGGLLYTSENDYDHQDPNKTGVIGVWDVKKRVKIGEFSSGGIGVHQLKLMPDGKTLVVANGGILTHPDHARQKLNLPDMQPNLSFISCKTGQLINQIGLPTPLHQLSIRHLDVALNGKVVIAMQYQGNKSDEVSLLAMVDKTRKLKFIDMPSDILAQKRQYIGSVCFDKTATYFAASSPRGNLVSFYRSDGQYIGAHKMQDVCAIGAFGNQSQFILASGLGHIDIYNARNATSHRLSMEKSVAKYRWDNHILAL